MATLEILPKRFEILDSTSSDRYFRVNVDVINECFGAERSMYMHACYPQGKNKTIFGSKEGEKFFVWMPKLYSNNSEWINSVSDDGKMIYETAEVTRHTDWMNEDKHDIEALRIVFVKPTPKAPYEFFGVYANDKMNFKQHSYRRIATKIRLIGNPVTRVEIVD